MEIETDSREIPWLREMVEEELHILFSENEDEIGRGVRHFIRLAATNAAVVDQLVDLIETALEYDNDDASASLWAVVILGEAGAEQALPVLRRVLMSNDETLQDAACVALLRLGPRALESIMEAIDEDEVPQFNRSAYPVLGMIGILDDPVETNRVADFLQERLVVERRAEPTERALEEIIHAISRIGDRRQIEPLKEILNSEFRGHNPAVQDAIELLEENVAGVPIGVITPPWEERYGWILEPDVPNATVERSRQGGTSLNFGDGPQPLAEEDAGDDARTEGYRRGLFFAADATEHDDDA